MKTMMSRLAIAAAIALVAASACASAQSSDDGASEIPEPTGPNAECYATCDAKLGPCKTQCVNDYPDTLEEWNAMCEEGMGVFGSMPSVEVCKERGQGEYACGENGPCTQSPQGNCKGRCEDEVPRCMDECDNPCEGDDCPKSVCKAACNDNGGYQQRAADKAPMWEGDVGSCKNQCHRFANSPTYQDEEEEAPSSDDGSSDDGSELPEVDEEDPNAECKSACAAKVGPCKTQCVNDYPDTLDDWNAMCEEGMGVFGSMPSVEVCKERGQGEYACGENGPCTQSPQGNCKGRCEDEVPRCMDECDNPCEGDDCPKSVCKAACNDNGGYQQRAADKAPMWEGDVGSCKNQCHRFANSPTYQDGASSDDG